MNKKLGVSVLLILSFFFIYNFSVVQIPGLTITPILSKNGNSDFNTAVEIKDSIFGPINVTQGYGKKMEYRHKDDYYMSEENSAWFKFTIDYDTLLIFDLVPKDPRDDYDFILFKCPD